MEISNTNDPIKPSITSTPPINPDPITPGTPPVTAPPVTPPSTPTPAPTPTSIPAPTMPNVGTPQSNTAVPSAAVEIPVKTTPAPSTPASTATDFPFKPIEPPSAPSKNDTMGMNLGDEVVKQDPIETKTVPANSDKEFKPMATPSAAPTSHAKSIITILSVAILFMALGLAGGYYGYKYSPKIAKLFSATADTTTPSNADTNIVNPPKSQTLGDVSVWPSYTNTLYKYALKYPDNWYSQGINNQTTKILSFTSFNPADSQGSGFEVNLDTQSLNGKTVKDWITDNNTVTGTSGTSVTPLTIGTQTAYQQTITGTASSIITYVPRGDSVMMLTYTGPTAEFATGQEIYNKIITSLTLN